MYNVTILINITFMKNSNHNPHNTVRNNIRSVLICLLLSGFIFAPEVSAGQRISFNDGWRFHKGDPAGYSKKLVYDKNVTWLKAGDAAGEEADIVELKRWIMPVGNKFIKDPVQRYVRPEGSAGGDCPFVQFDIDDSGWDEIKLPHDWAIEGPFMRGENGVGGGMGRLPSPGIGWYRNKFTVTDGDADKKIYLDIDGAMSYAAVWLNGNLVGGWPFGYGSWRVDLTPYVVSDGENQLAIRLDNPPSSSRWYPGGGIYRNVWLTKTSKVHVAQWGTFVTTKAVSAESAVVELEVEVENNTSDEVGFFVSTEIYVSDYEGRAAGAAVAVFEPFALKLKANGTVKATKNVTVKNPRLWGPMPEQKPNMYIAVTTVREGGKVVDKYETPFGIRSLDFNPDKGLLVNGERIYIKGVNQHHDLGSLGAAFNVRAAERQLEILREMGCNSVRMAHNPPAPELLELTDRMGFLVVDEVFDCWKKKKTDYDFHLVFDEWSEQDLRSMIRRDRNHPSVIVWSFGNEVGEQYSGEEGGKVAQRLHDIVKEEDTTRPTATAMNYAKPDMPLPSVADIITLNYQGEGIRNAPAYAGIKGINTEPLYEKFHKALPGKLIISSENAAALSSRGEYMFPVAEGVSAPVRDGSGGNSEGCHVSSYELYTADFGSSADKVFAAQASNPFVAGGFVWSGWDYLGEPTPYYSARSSYFGVIDLAGFKKNRFYLYQSHWRPELPMVYILPHWNWPDRIGEVTPVHVFTTGDEAELFLNGKSLGRKKKEQFEYRLRWDDVVYKPGELAVVSYRHGKKWAEAMVKTTDSPFGLKVAADRTEILADGSDLSFITVNVVDKDGLIVPNVDNLVTFSIEGPGEIVSTDNGDPTDLTPFGSCSRKAFNGYCLAVVRAIPGETGKMTVSAVSDSLEGSSEYITSASDRD